MVYIIIIKILKNQPYKKKKKVDFLFFLLQMVLLFWNKPSIILRDISQYIYTITVPLAYLAHIFSSPLGSEVSFT